jgi:biopolymer transport protein ExbB
MDVMAELGSAGGGMISALALGGPVLVLLLALSVLALGLILFKLVQFRGLGLGRHKGIDAAIAAWDGGQRERALAALGKSRNAVAPVLSQAACAPADQKGRAVAEAEAYFARLESGFRGLDSIAQVAPLLGLFGTVLGMIEAFQALQGAGAAVDPSILAGGIWVALLTTAAGLGVAMPTGLALTWLEARVARERAKVDVALEALSGRREAVAPGSPAFVRRPLAVGDAG